MEHRVVKKIRPPNSEAGSLRERGGVPIAREQQSSGRRVGVVVRVNEAGAFSFIRGVDGVEYFAHKSVYQPPMLYDEVVRAVLGTVTVTFLASESTKGWRAASVRVATAIEQEQVGDTLENRGNR